MRKLWRISQQDNYAGTSNNVNDFLLSLYINFGSCKFLYIVHDKEADKHIHVLLILDYGIDKKTLLEYFPKADIRTANASNRDNYDYLTHKNNEDKQKYNEEDIIRNNIDDEFLQDWLSQEKQSSKNLSDIEILDLIVDDIVLGKVQSYFEILQCYKGIALKYNRSIRETLALFGINN